MDEYTTWQEGETWYAAPRHYDPNGPVGEGETEEYAIINLRHKIDELNAEWRFIWETRNDEP